MTPPHGPACFFFLSFKLPPFSVFLLLSANFPPVFPDFPAVKTFSSSLSRILSFWFLFLSSVLPSAVFFSFRSSSLSFAFAGFLLFRHFPSSLSAPAAAAFFLFISIPQPPKPCSQWPAINLLSASYLGHPMGMYHSSLQAAKIRSLHASLFFFLLSII